MQRPKLLLVTVLLAGAVGPVALGLYSGGGRVEIEILRDQHYGADRRIVVFTVTGWSVEPYSSNNRVQAYLKDRWTEPAELFGGRGEVACIVPAEAHKCRLKMRAQRESPSERASALFKHCGLMSRLPKVCDWVICRLPKTRPPVSDVTVETSLPRIAHNVAASVDAPTVALSAIARRTRRATDQHSSAMKTFVAVFCIGAWLACASAQGLVNFFNGAGTLVNFSDNGVTSLIDGRPGDFYFALLTSPVGANTFTFAGVYATNTEAAGLFNGGAGVAVNGWAPGTARDFEVVGWLPGIGGVIFNPSWLTDTGSVGETIYWGFSAIGTGVAGGPTSSGTLPNLDIFGGASGIQQGFQIDVESLVPEPSSLSLAVLGATAVLIFRRRRAEQAHAA
jgi:hypothetical protein